MSKLELGAVGARETAVRCVGESLYTRRGSRRQIWKVSYDCLIRVSRLAVLDGGISFCERPLFDRELVYSVSSAKSLHQTCWYGRRGRTPCWYGCRRRTKLTTFFKKLDFRNSRGRIFELGRGADFRVFGLRSIFVNRRPTQFCWIWYSDAGRQGALRYVVFRCWYSEPHHAIVASVWRACRGIIESDEVIGELVRKALGVVRGVAC